MRPVNIRSILSFRASYPITRTHQLTPSSYAYRSLATVADTRETGFKIPIVDVNTFLTGSPTSKTRVAKEILEGFTSSGFIYLGNTGLPSGAVSNVFSWSYSVT